MELYDYISTRKSTRKYDTTPFDEDTMLQILQYAENLKPLYPDIRVKYETVNEVSGLMSAKAPCYFLISSEIKNGYLENAGFMFQQMSLYLSSRGFGSCWIGMAKPTTEVETQLPFVIALAFGKAADSPYRALSEYKRKSLSNISSGSDERIESARLAPSAINNQNWFFAANNGNIDVFCKKSVMAMFAKTNRIDIGIALCHLFVATEHFGKDFVFANETGKEKKGYIYIGTVK